MMPDDDSQICQMEHADIRRRLLMLGRIGSWDGVESDSCFALETTMMIMMMMPEDEERGESVRNEKMPDGNDTRGWLMMPYARRLDRNRKYRTPRTD